MTELVDDLLPELTFELAQEIGEFPAYELTVSEQDVAAYRRLTGDDHELYERFLPPGFAGIFGRDAYLQDHRMPPGGVLLAQDITWLRPARWDQPLTLQAMLLDAVEQDGRRTLIFQTRGWQDGELAVVVQIKAGWP
jgi:hypothetical protein